MKIYSPAKINLFLNITGKRPDGYHDLVSLICCLGLFDRVTLEIGVPHTIITCNDSKVPQNETNLARRAAACFYQKLSHHSPKAFEHVAIHIDKRIPVAAGLGGGSSNAAAVLIGLNRYYRDWFSQSDLMVMGQSIGADVPFFIFRRPAIATGIGEQLEFFNGLQPYHILLVWPGFEVSTTEVFDNLDLGLTNCEKKLTKNLLKNRPYNAADHLCNDLEPVVAKKYSEIIEIKETLLRHGAAGASMSGSGPTVFGLFADIDTAQNAHQALARHRTWRLFLTDMLFDSEYRITDT
ncbi:MAG: 4-(cytidine 5'-diphospho)-2-C-methyl-D-erythritol kinase [Desulfobacterales bacterium]|jgi:4-diphosphocytidyl-2-C-methyl-D-erythritol kinase